jgi:hypothetical protein
VLTVLTTLGRAAELTTSVRKRRYLFGASALAYRLGQRDMLALLAVSVTRLSPQSAAY